VIHNFGRNVAFQPQVVLTPRTEADVLQCLSQHRGRRIRAMGRLHAWSEAARSDDVLLDLRHINHVQTEHRPDGVWATVGAGCQIKRLLAELERQADVTLPSLGLVTEQAIAGAISTGTHGSGKHSLSHDMAEVRVATYDAATGEPVIRTISDGPELRAARCSLGCLGVILSVGFWCRAQYRVEEHFARYANLDDVLSAEERYPLQQFYLVPWMWAYYAQHRRETDAPRSGLARLYRWYCFLTLDIGLHLAVITLSRWLQSRRAIHVFFRHILPWTVIRGWKVTDRSQAMLIMEHELFRHIEIEVFVQRPQLADALMFAQQLLRHCDGERDAFSDDIRHQLQQHGLWDDVQASAGCFTACYPICIRKILPDDTLISMASSDGEPYYSLSFISYARPNDRDGFFRFANCLSDATVALYAARPHWGKVCPLTATQAATLYPHLPAFRRVAREFDAAGVFLNDWVAGVLFGKNGQIALNPEGSQPLAGG